MANVMMSLGPNFEVDIVYTKSTGKATGLRVFNQTGGDAFAQATLEDGRTFGRVFPPGDTTINIPNNIVTVTFDADGNANFNGLASVETRIPA